MADIIGKILIIAGLVLDVFGCIGLVRLPDVYTRIQASVKCITLGTCAIMLGAIVYVGFWTPTGVKAVFAVLFVLLTAPAAAHSIARAAHRSGVRLGEKSVCDTYEEGGK